MIVTVKLTMRNGSKYTLDLRTDAYVIQKERTFFGPKPICSLSKSTCTIEEAVARTVKHSGSELYYHEFFDERGVKLNKADEDICKECRTSVDETRYLYIGLEAYEKIAQRCFALRRSHGEDYALQEYQKDMERETSKKCSAGRVRCTACDGTGGLASGNMGSGYWVEKCSTCGTKGHVQCGSCHGTGKARPR